MLISQLIDDATRFKLFKIKDTAITTKKHKKKSKSLSQHELKDLMGVNRDRYHKVHGKVKRK